MTQRQTIAEFKAASTPITEPISKFGGQPVWIEDPAWPISESWDRPMQFLAQIAIPPSLSTESKMAYIFVTHQRPNERDDKNWFFDPDACFSGAGENAVIIQPGGQDAVPTRTQATGPTTYLEDGSDCEFTIDLVQTTDPAFLSGDDYQKAPQTERDTYFDTVSGNKIGGVPAFFQGDDWPGEDPDNWDLLVQIDANTLPFHLNLGASPICFVFISKDHTEGRFFCQDS
ncbi:MAG: DUF1963 domain-containing protein [Phycisphaeraceae bacterium]